MSYTIYSFVLFMLFCQALTQDGCNFKCTGEQSFEMSGMNFTCTGSYLCNKFNANRDCKPCVSYTIKCKNFYKCLTTKPCDTIIGGTQVKCPEEYKCNSMAVGDCSPCIHKGCPSKPDFTCDKVVDTLVYVQNMVVFCKDGTVCNRNNEAPCYPCITNKTAQASFGAYYLD